MMKLFLTGFAVMALTLPALSEVTCKYCGQKRQSVQALVAAT